MMGEIQLSWFCKSSSKSQHETYYVLFRLILLGLGTMFGWKKKNDGFEWREYVRTTVKLRRADRRRRIEDAKQAVADGVREAGAKGASAGRTAAGRSWAWIKVAFRRSVSFLGWCAVWSWYWIKLANWWLVGLLRVLFQRVMAFVGRHAPRLPLLPTLFVVGLITALASYIWQISFGASQATIIGEGLGLAAIVVATCWSAARRFGLTWSWPQPPGFVAHLGAVGRYRPSWRVLAGAGLATVIAAIWFSWSSVSGYLPNPSLSSFTVTPTETITGHARAVSGDTIRLAGRLIRLEGIEAPELLQRCKTKTRRRWRCGRAARAALGRLVNRRKIVCTVSGRDNGGRTLAACRTSKTDLAKYLVERGYVFAATGFFARYSEAEGTAKEKRRGIWRGNNERPTVYRNRRWKTATARAPSGCPIKGAVRRGKRIYVPPWTPGYSRVTVRQRRGERWFCSEAEAFSAGWRPAEKS